jgi:SAM-dependent methyltransferase/MFS family permease
MPLYAATIFVSAFLLFLVQPIVAKQILPWFGGSAAVWTTCVFFFQFLLLAGYAYAHAIVRWLPPRPQLLVHLALLAVSLASLPIIAAASWKPSGAEDPAFRILGLLVATVGLPYFLLSTTSPLVQAWYARRFDSPYRLFALSNLASLAALLLYPVAVEPLIPTRAQALSWSWAYAGFVALCAATAIYSLRRAVGSGQAPVRLDPGPAPAAGVRLQWVALPALASLLLLAITNHLTQNVASIPFLWVLPLSLYLLTFILCFDGRGWYRRAVFFPLAGLAVAAMAWVLTSSDLIHNLKLSIPLFSAGLFVLCMLCHGELVLMKPVPARLTEFYMLIALGGAVGSMLVSVIAPHVLPGDFEVAAGLALAAIVLAWKVAPLGRVALAGALAAVAFTGYGVVTYVSNNVADTRVMKRNFYSSLRTRDEQRDEGRVRKLIHGTINHGEQFVDEDKRRRAIAYFGPKAGIVLALEALRHPDMRVGIVGLGAGTMAAYGRPGDVYKFYEINPQVIELAQTEFSYLKDSDAKIELVLGDGRLALESGPPQRFDLLAADAFSSDSVPMHLITKEALELYMRNVRPGGVVVFNVTNRYLDLAPVVKRLADALGLHARLVSHSPDEEEYNLYSVTDFVLVTADPKLFDRPQLAGVAQPIEVPAKVSVWTDDFNNLLQALR